MKMANRQEGDPVDDVDEVDLVDERGHGFASIFDAD
jgi:hypothetical protein